MRVFAIGGAVTGRGHMSVGNECQDKFQICERRGVCAAVLCDGAGSKKDSATGAAVASAAAAQLLAEQFERFMKLPDSEIAAEIVRCCQSKIDRLEGAASQYSCTLLFAVTDGDRFIAGNLGDGKVIFCDIEARLLLAGESGTEPNSTYFITERDAAAHLFVEKGFFGDTCIILTTDGAGGSLYDSVNSRVSPAAMKIKGWTENYSPDEVQEILSDNLKNVFRNTTLDDVSIVLIYRERGESVDR